MNPLSLVADCDAVSLTGDAVDPGTVRWVLNASRDGYEATLLTMYVHYEPFCRCGPDGGEALPATEHKDECSRPDRDPPEGAYCLAGVLAEYLGATLHVSGPLRHGWPPRPIQEFVNSAGEPIPGTQAYAVPESARVVEHLDPSPMPPGRSPFVATWHEPQPWPDAMERDAEGRSRAGTGPHPHNARETWRDDGKCLWKSCHHWRTVGDLEAYHHAQGWDRPDEKQYVRAGLCPIHRCRVMPNGRCSWRQGGHDPARDISPTFTPEDDTTPARPYAKGCPACGRHTCPGRDETRRCVWEEHPHGTPETWDDAGGCTYPGCPVAKAPERCQADMGAMRVGGPRMICGKPLPCPEHTSPPSPPQCRHGYTHGHHYTDETRMQQWCAGPDTSTQGQGDELRTQQSSPAAESDVRAPTLAHEVGLMAQFWSDTAEAAIIAIDRSLLADGLRDACLVVRYVGSGSLETGLRLCGLRRPCRDHETAETAEHDETCQHDEPAGTYCGFAYPHQPHPWHPNDSAGMVDCPGKPRSLVYPEYYRPEVPR